MSFAFHAERQKINYPVNPVNPVGVFVCYVFIFHCVLDRIDRICWIFVFFSFLLPAIARRSGEADEDETDKEQSASRKFCLFRQVWCTS